MLGDLLRRLGRKPHRDRRLAELLCRQVAEHRESVGLGGGARRLRRRADAGLEVRRLLRLARLLGLNGVFSESSTFGIEPRIGNGVKPTASWNPTPLKLGTAFGNLTVFVPPPAWTRTYWPLASPDRLSEAIPASP